MTEFTPTLRHRCRNPRCRLKLPAPVQNPREAFCARGCHSSFYRRRCLICERPMERKTEHQLICGKRRCRNALSSADYLGRYQASQNQISSPKNPIKSGIKSAHAGDRPWRIVAGPPLTPSQLHCAGIPDGRNGEWAGGGFERYEARNPVMLGAQFDKLAVDLCTICGRDDDLVDTKVADSWLTTCRGCRPAPAPRAGGAPSTWQPGAAPLPEGVEPDDLSIPDFLRNPEPIPKSATGGTPPLGGPK